MRVKLLALGLLVIVVGIVFLLGGYGYGGGTQSEPGSDPEEYNNYLNMTVVGYVMDAVGAVLAVVGFVSRRRKPETKLSTVVHRGATSKTGFCPHCGKLLVPDEPYCPGCGRQLKG
ncbi:MAG TPA: zinc ribbon domain-containing protein [Thermoplasmata archaeon]